MPPSPWERLYKIITVACNVFKIKYIIADYKTSFALIRKKLSYKLLPEMYRTVL